MVDRDAGSDHRNVDASREGTVGEMRDAECAGGLVDVAAAGRTAEAAAGTAAGAPAGRVQEQPGVQPEPPAEVRTVVGTPLPAADMDCTGVEVGEEAEAAGQQGEEVGSADVAEAVAPAADVAAAASSRHSRSSHRAGLDQQGERR